MRRPARASPLLLQLVMLLLATIILAQAVTFLVVSAAPEPSPRTYTLDEIVAAFEGGAGAGTLPRRRRALPPAFTTGVNENAAARIAERLGAPASDVRFIFRPASLLSHLTIGAVAQAPPQRHAGQSIQGAFAAAWRRDGAWRIVEPAPDWEGVRRIALALGAGVLLVAPLVAWFALRITRPLLRLASAAEAIGRDPLAPPAPAMKADAEIGAAGASFTRMQIRVQRYLRDRVGAFAAISHDLRTPLTRIKFKVEGAAEKLREGVLADVASMEAMLAAVLGMMRDTHMRGPHAAVSLGAIVAKAAEATLLAGRDIEIGDAGGGCVMGDPLALERLFANLIENATKYGARARVAFLASGEEIEITITDFGPGLSPAELERVFEPFYRAPSSPESAQNAEGIGLGLWIARSIARTHGGELTLRDTPAGLVASVRLPLAPRAPPPIH